MQTIFNSCVTKNFLQITWLIYLKIMSTITLCETPGCKLEARLQCPTCIKLGVKGSFFCTQECFKENWNVHKVVHKKQTAVTTQPMTYNPWPGFTFTGLYSYFFVCDIVPSFLLQVPYVLILKHPNVLSLLTLLGQIMLIILRDFLLENKLPEAVPILNL